MIPFKLITAHYLTPTDMGQRFQKFSPRSSLPDTANPLCQSFAFSPDQTPRSFLSFLLGPVLQTPAGLSRFLYLFPQMQCPTLAPVLQRCQSTRRRNTGHSKSILLFMEDCVCCCWGRMMLAKQCVTHHDPKTFFSGAPPTTSG